MAVDGTGLLVRCSRAAARTGMHAPDGTPTGALMLFASSLSSMAREVQPDRMLVAWDGPKAREWRRKICPEYKAGRPEFPDKRPVEGGQVREFCGAAGIAQWSLDEFEADDLLAAACRLAARDLPGTRVMVVSDDRDVLQLAEADRVYVRTLGKEGRVIEEEEVTCEWGVSPVHLPKLRALAGDASDGVPGLPRTGPMRALQVLRAAGLAWPLPAASVPDPALYSQVLAWHDVMNLNGAPEVPEAHDVTGVLDIRQTHWKRGNVLPVLEKYAMRSLAERWSKGTLW